VERPREQDGQSDWWIKAEDPTPNDLELWYDNTRQIEVSLVAEGTTLGPYKIGTSNRSCGGTTIGYIDHNVNLNGDCCALIWMFETGAPLPGLPPPPTTGAGPARRASGSSRSATPAAGRSITTRGSSATTWALRAGAASNRGSTPKQPTRAIRFAISPAAG
jgi:hypothetical protein